MLNRSVDCRVTRLTPHSRGAVATLAVEGRDAARLLAQYFQPARGRGAELPLGTIVFGRWQGPSGATEEVVVCRRADLDFEINCHGGSAASDALVRTLVAAGAAQSSDDEYLQHRVSDPVQRAAWLELRHTATARAAGILMDQYRGALARSVGELAEWLEQSPPRDSAVSLQITDRVRQLLDWAPLGLHLTTPWQVVLAGPPNVGKSSLLNAILGYPRALVFDQPGTTRDVLSARTALDGWLIEIHDTAGLRDSEDAIEQEGVQRARAQSATADLVVFVTDSSLPPNPLDDASLSAANVLQVANKCDLPPRRDGSPREGLRLSARTGEGLDQLAEAIVRRLVPRSPPAGEAVPFTAEQVADLRCILEAVRAGRWNAALAACRRVWSPASRHSTLSNFQA